VAAAGGEAVGVGASGSGVGVEQMPHLVVRWVLGPRTPAGIEWKASERGSVDSRFRKDTQGMANQVARCSHGDWRRRKKWIPRQLRRRRQRSLRQAACCCFRGPCLSAFAPPTSHCTKTARPGRVWFGFFLVSLSEKLAVGKSWLLEKLVVRI
jgi:hypothetical protein